MSLKTSKKNIDISITNKKNTTKILSHNKGIISNFRFIIENFASITGINIRSTINFVADIALKISKKINILSKPSFIATITFLSKKSLAIEAQSEFKSIANFSKKSKLEINSNLEFINRKETILKIIDGFTLDELDVLTLAEIGFTNGLRFILEKRTQIEATSTFESTVSLLEYYYNKLYDYDGLTLNSIDGTTLIDMTRTLI